MATFEEKVLEEAYSVTPNFSVNYNDPRLGNIESDKSDAIKESDKLYAGMIDKSDAFYDKQIQASQDWADKQTELQNQRTDFAIDQINQQKDQAHKDYLKEQSGAYVDWQKQSNQYGTEAERMASAGLTSTGFAESSQVSMYNTYQNRVATAREAFGRAVLNYDNAIKDAMLQNNAALAEIAYNALQKQLELSLEGFQYKNQLILDQANKKLEIDNMYWNRYQDVLDQINTENAVKADIWKYQDSQKWQTEQNEIQRDFEAEQNKIQRDFEAAEAKIDRDFKAKEAELDRKFELELQKAKDAAEKARIEQEHKNAMAILEQQKKDEKELLNHKKLLEIRPNEILGSGSNASSRLNSYANIGTSFPVKASGGTKSTKNSGTNNSAKITNKSSNNTQAVRIKSAPQPKTLETYSEMVSFLTRNGVPQSAASKAMTHSEWSRRRASYSMTGQGATEVKNYSSYSAYLTDYASYCIATYKK